MPKLDKFRMEYSDTGTSFQTYFHFSKRKLSDYVTYKDLSKEGKHAERVKILQHSKGKRDFIVKKKYPKKYSNIFYNEVYWLLRLQCTNNFPKVIAVDLKSHTFWMTYCGRPVTKEELVTTFMRQKIKIIETMLYERYSCYHNDVKEGNVCIKGEGEESKVYLIDCGWMAPFRLLPGYSKHRYGFTNPNCFSEMKEKCIFLLCKKISHLS